MRAYIALAMLAASPLSTTPAVAQETGVQPDWLSQAKIAADLEGITIGEAVRRARLQKLAIEQGERVCKRSRFCGQLD